MAISLSHNLDLYNKEVNDINGALATSNKILTAMNSGREKILANRDVTGKRFMALHVPEGEMRG